MKELIDRLKELHLTISSCESLTGGLFAAKITAVSGASKVYRGSLITYQNDVKAKLLNVDLEEIEKYGAVSYNTASIMALKCKEILNSDIAVSFTGNAGPDVLENKPVGLVYIGIAIKDYIKVDECQFNGDRAQIQEACLSYAKKAILDYLVGKS